MTEKESLFVVKRWDWNRHIKIWTRNSKVHLSIQPFYHQYIPYFSKSKTKRKLNNVARTNPFLSVQSWTDQKFAKHMGSLSNASQAVNWPFPKWLVMGLNFSLGQLVLKISQHQSVPKWITTRCLLRTFFPSCADDTVEYVATSSQMSPSCWAPFAHSGAFPTFTCHFQPLPASLCSKPTYRKSVVSTTICGCGLTGLRKGADFDHSYNAEND